MKNSMIGSLVKKCTGLKYDTGIFTIIYYLNNLGQNM